MGIFDGIIKKRVDAEIKQYMKALQSDVLNIALRNIQYLNNGFVNAPWSADFGIKKGYNGNATVYSIVSQQAEKASTIPLLLKYKRKDGESEEITDHPILELLERPNANQSGMEFIEQMIGYLQLTGAAISWKLKLSTNKVQELHILPTHLITLQTKYGNNAVVEIAKYVVQAAMAEFPREEIIHVKYPDYNWTQDGRHLLGMSPIRAGRNSVNRKRDGEKASMKQLQNDGAKGMLTPRESGIMLDEDQADALRNRLDEDVNGVDNRSKVMIAQIPMDYHNMGMTSADMDILNAEKYTDSEICRIFKHPPVLLDSERATENNYETAIRHLISQTLYPMLRRVCEEFRRSLIIEYPDLVAKKAWLEPDITGMPEMQKDILKMAQAANTAWWLTVNEKRAMTNYPADPEHGDKMMIPTGLIDINEAGLEDPLMEADNQFNEEE